MTKRDLMTKVFNNERAERVPAGFWFHFAEDELLDGFKHPGTFEQNIKGEIQFYKEFQPDFIKIMTDGFFVYPDKHFTGARSIDDLKKVVSIGSDHPWIEKQVEYAKTLYGIFGKEIFSFYNIFAPATLFRFGHYNFYKENHCQNQDADKLLAALIAEDAAVVAAAFTTVANDSAVLARRIIGEAKIDGIYYSTQDPADKNLGEALRKTLYVDNDMAVLDAAVALSRYNILHICGYAGYKNKLDHFVDYPAQIINWASVVEQVPLSAGKKLFHGKPVIGGFGNTKNDVLWQGVQAEIEAETERLVKEAGTTGIVIGADCTVPRGINLQHLKWARDKAASLH
jgi:uroporphyrinogen decarboxylase